MAKGKPRRGAKASRRSTRGGRKAAVRRRRTGRSSTRTASRGAQRSRKKPAKKAAKPGRPATRASAARKGRTRMKASAGRGGTSARTAAGPKSPPKVLPKRPTGQHRLQIDRARRVLEEAVPGPPSSLDLDRHASAARSGRVEIQQARREHTESSPRLTGGDVDANWASAFSTGDEAPGGDMPTPDQDVVEEIGTSLGVQYADDEELKAADKIAERDRHRWELDPASSEDYRDRTGKKTP